MSVGAHLGQRRGLTRVDQPQRAAQQRVHERVIPDQPRLVGGPAQEPHRLTALRGVVDGVDHREVQLRSDREQLRHAGQPPRHRQLHVASPLRAQVVHERVAKAIVAEPHRLMRSRLHHQQPLFEGGREHPVVQIR